MNYEVKQHGSLVFSFSLHLYAFLELTDVFKEPPWVCTARGIVSSIGGLELGCLNRGVSFLCRCMHWHFCICSASWSSQQVPVWRYSFAGVFRLVWVSVELLRLDWLLSPEGEVWLLDSRTKYAEREIEEVQGRFFPCNEQVRHNQGIGEHSARKACNSWKDLKKKKKSMAMASLLYTSGS